MLILGCARSNALVLPDRTVYPGEWTKEEKAREITIKTLYVDQGASYHLVRLKGAETPHIHAKHDLTVVVHKGKSVIHFENRSVPLAPGEVIRILRGTPHWAENVGRGASEVYAIFTPPFYGEDIVNI